MPGTISLATACADAARRLASSPATVHGTAAVTIATTFRGADVIIATPAGADPTLLGPDDMVVLERAALRGLADAAHDETALVRGLRRAALDPDAPPATSIAVLHATLDAPALAAARRRGVVVPPSAPTTFASLRDALDDTDVGCTLTAHGIGTLSTGEAPSTAADAIVATPSPTPPDRRTPGLAPLALAHERHGRSTEQGAPVLLTSVGGALVAAQTPEGLARDGGLLHDAAGTAPIAPLHDHDRIARPAPAAHHGEVALVTGAASGIGRATALALRRAGAAIIALDRDDAHRSDDVGWHTVRCELTDVAAVRAAVDDGVSRFGGIDIAVTVAGVFPASHPIVGFPSAAWQRSLDVNVTALLTVLDAVHPYLARSPRGGRLVHMGTKNVPAPGPGSAAYSASKAAATQLARVAALEWARDGIRVNVVNPEGVFDTALWTPELLAERAASYGLTVDEYRRRNLLRREVTSASVAAVILAMCGEAFATTTGAQIPVDGGSDRVI